MDKPQKRRDFLKKGTAAVAGMAVASTANAQDAPQKKVAPGGSEAREAQVPRQEGAIQVPVPTEKLPFDGKYDLPEEFKVYDRYYPTYGGPENSPTFLGKLVPGLRASGLPPVPFVQPDVPRLPWTMVDGYKEFHLVLEHVRRELLPGKWMDMYGVNGSMPAPYIELTQGDRVRLIVHNHLPEPTTVHWHGAELPANMDGVPGTTQDFIDPGQSFVYQFRVHQSGTFFYHAHVPFQEANGIVGFMIIHPAIAWDPPVDRDFGLFVSNISVSANTTVATPFADHPAGVAATPGGQNWSIMNGRSAPYSTPFVCKLGERVRIRVFNFSVVDIHAMHMHGTNFWITGHEGARQPFSNWVNRNTTQVHVAQSNDFEFIANDPGDWVFHCHMAMHMLNHPVPQQGPRVRSGESLARYKANLDDRPPVQWPHTDPGFLTPGYPKARFGMGQWTPAELEKINSKREVRGMRHNWYLAPNGLFTVVRVLPEDLYDLVMHSDTPLKPGATFDEIVRRRTRQESEREEMRRKGLTLNQWQDWMEKNELERRRGLV